MCKLKEQQQKRRFKETDIQLTKLFGCDWNSLCLGRWVDTTLISLRSRSRSRSRLALKTPSKQQMDRRFHGLHERLDGWMDGWLLGR